MTEVLKWEKSEENKSLLLMSTLKRNERVGNPFRGRETGGRPTAHGCGTGMTWVCRIWDSQGVNRESWWRPFSATLHGEEDGKRQPKGCTSFFCKRLKRNPG